MNGMLYRLAGPPPPLNTTSYKLQGANGPCLEIVALYHVMRKCGGNARRQCRSERPTAPELLASALETVVCTVLPYA
jgi:hypothetical protein